MVTQCSIEVQNDIGSHMEGFMGLESPVRQSINHSPHFDGRICEAFDQTSVGDVGCNAFSATTRWFWYADAPNGGRAGERGIGESCVAIGKGSSSRGSSSTVLVGGDIETTTLVDSAKSLNQALGLVHANRLEMQASASCLQ